MRRITAAVSIFLLALASFGVAIAIEIPYTADDAMRCAEDRVGDPGGAFVWKCPTSDGSSYTNETLELGIGKDDFEDSMSRNVLRSPTVFASVPLLLVDPDDRYVRQVADRIGSETEGCPDRVRIAAALGFVQTSIRYTSDRELYGCEEFWASPVETLYLRAGDCEDTAVLLCSILGAMGIGWVLLDYDGHEAVGAFAGDGPAQRGYLYCETAADGILTPGIGAPSAEPRAYSPGDVSGLDSALGGFVAGCRNLIQRVTGT